MALSDYRKYGAAAEKLQNAVKNNMVSHAYIIEGGNNIDKEGFARAFAKALLCKEEPGEGCDLCATCKKIAGDNHEDIYIVEPTWNDSKTKKSIKDKALEELQSNLKTKPTGGDHNVAIIQGGDTMTPRAQNRFLKTLEEPNPGTVIMILSENAENLLPTINSRCIKCRLIDFQGKSETKMTALANEIVEMIGEREFFFDIKKKLDKKIKDRTDAAAFLDGMEDTFGIMLRSGSGPFSRQWLISSIKLIEKAQEELRRNVSHKYSIRNLILKLEEH